MRIDPGVLVKSIGDLGDLDPEGDLPRAVQRLVDGAKRLFGADGVGLMLIDADGDLRWAAASDQRTQNVEAAQERCGQGPCIEAFSQRVPVAIADVTAEPQWRQLAGVMVAEGVHSAASVPVELDGSPVGTLDAYSAAPWDWDASEISALETYAGLVATVLVAAATAHLQGRMAKQLQTALEHRGVIEQAKGVLMEREGLDATAAFERLRRTARSSERKVVDVAEELLAGGSLPPPDRFTQAVERARQAGAGPDQPAG